MSEYFSYFPTIEHDLTNEGQKVTLTNVLRRFIVRSDLQERTDVYYDYNIQYGDRPDIIAEKYYGDADLAWLVLHFNNMKDPIFDFPLFGQNFDDYIKGKYGSIPNAQREIHEYRQILTQPETKFDGTIIPKLYIVIDETTYNGLSESDREAITKYDWEEELNEQKRQIKLLDKRFLDKVRDEVESVLRDGV